MANQSLKSICRLIQVDKIEPPEKDFLQELKRSIELTSKRESRKPSATYKPSSMKCIRNMYFQVTGEELDDETENYCLIGICDSGTDRHERIQNAVADMKNNGFDCEYVDVGQYVINNNLENIEVISKQGNETKLFDKSLNISFLCDGIILYKGNYYILEIKTESIYKWQSRTDVNPEHYNQAISYSNSLGINNVIFLYINRDNTDMKSYMYTVTDDMRDTLVNKIKECDTYVEKKKCPPKPSDMSTKLCQYCNYKTACRRN